MIHNLLKEINGLTRSDGYFAQFEKIFFEMLFKELLGRRNLVLVLFDIFVSQLLNSLTSSINNVHHYTNEPNGPILVSYLNSKISIL